MRFHFRVILFTERFGYDPFSVDIYARSKQSAFNKLFRELGPLRQHLFGVFIDRSQSDLDIF